MNKKLKKAYLCYIAKRRKSGGRLMSYSCPSCGETIETPVPSSKGEVWDTLSECPFCEGLHFKISTFSEVTASVPEVTK